jgi:hypothetical protein
MTAVRAKSIKKHHLKLRETQYNSKCRRKYAMIISIPEFMQLWPKYKMHRGIGETNYKYSQIYKCRN